MSQANTAEFSTTYGLTGGHRRSLVGPIATVLFPHLTPLNPLTRQHQTCDVGYQLKQG